ncbi:putative glyceraldehyde-3-phosphate dehydrogenase (phosphorylating) [Helianthus annuus]|nr:putative glyceraldehyde-3-phosphate dehydrogenase (phosphorylating) [Helianthus annuus]
MAGFKDGTSLVATSLQPWWYCCFVDSEPVSRCLLFTVFSLFGCYFFHIESVHGQWKHHKLKVNDKKTLFWPEARGYFICQQF